MLAKEFFISSASTCFGLIMFTVFIYIFYKLFFAESAKEDVAAVSENKKENGVDEIDEIDELEDTM
jgi:hypothetical protein